MKGIGYSLRFTVYSLLFIVYSFCISCTSSPKDVAKLDALPEIYPDYIGVTIPADIAPLNFDMVNEDFDRMDVVASGSKGGAIQ